MGILCIFSGLGLGQLTTRDLSRPPDSWGMSLSLLPHQAQALGWVKALSCRGLGSVLSDEPGTGKVRRRLVR